MAKRRVPIERTSTLAGAVSDGMSEVQTLRDEMREWQENMENANMTAVPKYEEVTECVDTLEQGADDEPSIPNTFPVGLVDEVKWIEPMGKSSRHVSRSLRLDQALAGLRAVADHVTAFLEEFDNPENPHVYTDTTFDEWETYRDEVQALVDNLEGASFPGMF